MVLQPKQCTGVGKVLILVNISSGVSCNTIFVYVRMYYN